VKSWGALLGSAHGYRGLTKSQAERQHAKRRARERYGIAFNSQMNKNLIAQIQRGEARLVRRQSQRVSVWDVEIAGGPARVVYDRDRKQIVTFLPLALEPWQKEQSASLLPMDEGENVVIFLPVLDAPFTPMEEEGMGDAAGAKEDKEEEERTQRC
jgi:hypothetical protein